MDDDGDGLIKFEEFRLLDEENFNKIDPLERLLHNMKRGKCDGDHDDQDIPSFMKGKKQKDE